MADKDIVQNMISQLGQSQDRRLAPELDRDHPDFVAVDERSGPELLDQARDLATMLRFYRDTPLVSSGDWSDYLSPGEGDAAVVSVDGRIAPHLGLFGAFLNLYRYPQQCINRITARHLDFQLLDVLGFVAKPARPDRAHLLIELKKGVPPIRIEPGQRFIGGKDERGVELLYEPTREFVVGHGKVASVRSVFHNADGVFFAPIAASGDGLGGPLPAGQSGWRPFGGPYLSPARIGFALASPVLRLGEGTRRVEAKVALKNASVELTEFGGSVFEAYVTGPKGWLGPIPVDGARQGDTLSLAFTLDPGSPPVVDFDPEAHGQDFGTHAPIVQFHLKTDGTMRYDALSALRIGKASIGVEVDALKTLELENDGGTLNPKKAFLPFGAQPVRGSRFFIGSAEALSKRLSELKVRLTWQGAPNLARHYQHYKNGSRMQDGVMADLVYEDRSGPEKSAEVNIMARDAGETTTLDPNAPPPPPKSESASQSRISALAAAGSWLARELGLKRFLRDSTIVAKAGAIERFAQPVPRGGFITLVLREDFLHADYRRETVERALAKDTVVLPEPYTPKVQEISLSYKARSDEVDVDDASEESFTSLDVQFFHVGCFGPMREHRFLRTQAEFLDDKEVTLLPRYESEGELLIGIAGVKAGDGVTLLMQAAEGSADPELDPQELEWSVLCDNYWRVLTTQELFLDTSNDLRTSGIVGVTLPHETTTEHTLLDTGLVWLRATVPESSLAACRLLAVDANAVEVRFVDADNDPMHLAKALPARSIAKLKAPQASVKTILQPQDSFGGSSREVPGSLTRRAAERLRHRNRCIAPWDYERMVLEAFPGVHKVKCIPHASKSSWFAPGHVMLVVVPDLHNPNAIDPLRPRVDLDTIDRIGDFVRGRCPMGLEIHVKNPRYRRVRLDFNVRLRPGYPFNFYRGELERKIVESLAPWAYGAARTVEFGGRVYRSVLLDIVEELDYVDFVTDFKLGLAGDGMATIVDASDVSPDLPDAILVPDPSHGITELLDD